MLRTVGNPPAQSKKSQRPPYLVSGMLPQVSRAVVANPARLAERAGVSTAPRFRSLRAPLPSSILAESSEEEGAFRPAKKLLKKRPAPRKVKKGKEPMWSLEQVTSHVSPVFLLELIV